MNPNPFIQVRSAKFAVLPGEEEELVNDGLYGKAFADYLQSRLASEMFLTPAVVCEDWGWWVKIEGLPFGCGLCVYGVRIDGTNDLDLCMTVSPSAGRRWSWRRFRRIDTSADIHRIYNAIRKILRADADVTLLEETNDFPLA